MLTSPRQSPSSHYDYWECSHLELDCLVVLHADLEVDWRVWDCLVMEADVEAVLPEAVGGDALVSVVMGVQHRLYHQTRLPGAVANL